MPNLSDLLPAIVAIAHDAGAEIMKIYATDFDVNWKSDSSPVTAADEGAEAIILPKLRELTPDYTIVAEEAVSKDGIPNIDTVPFWLVDPLDGTREFLNRNDEFTVNIALVIDKEPKLGVIYVPALDTTYTGVVGVGATRQVGKAAPESISVRVPPEEGVTVLASRRHGDPETLSAFLKDRPIAEIRNAGSSLKLCLVAAGEGDIYPRFGNTMEWDIAAGHAILSAAGGRVTTEDGAPMLYGKKTMLNPHFIAWGGLD
ncbi:MAG: 3'(2'),5'-bisphosphate nucleotidase CysQ [Rhodospirillaceae bacterium]|nr:3'(2'),5'-bisphosphate nucleotidase CysQ [Rhodospirillaceae bacterium]MBT5664243.1 3'(2'),5'-bisphosphate nucleotidase CysQ [Rhodospirillaceae bacterium]MBT5811529.1 3'(2'),5'-bisphosphate nucleotidase CysQ [Rhodospirillaceae bacterium]